jgi:hypothetical protein
VSAEGTHPFPGAGNDARSSLLSSGSGATRKPCAQYSGCPATSPSSVVAENGQQLTPRRGCLHPQYGNRWVGLAYKSTPLLLSKTLFGFDRLQAVTDSCR